MRLRAVQISLATIFLVLIAATAFAQTTVRVTGTRVNIWRPGLLTVATIVDQGATLEVVARRGAFLEVILPGIRGRELGETGLIAMTQVELVSGVLPVDQAPAPPRPRPGQPAVAARPPAPDTGVRGFADAGVNRFLARQSFEAILDQPIGTFLGGGIEYRTREKAFAQASVRWFRSTGERVFVDEGDVFRLGISNTVTIVPVAVTGGYRFGRTGAIPYLGAGVGTYIFREVSAFADDSDNIDKNFASYHVVGGIEWRTRAAIAAAVEAQFTHVPKALDGPAAESFAEQNLGGLEVRVKVVFGR